MILLESHSQVIRRQPWAAEQGKVDKHGNRVAAGGRESGATSVRWGHLVVGIVGMVAIANLQSG